MDPSRFVAPEFGQVVRTPGRASYLAFRPAPLMRTLELETATVLALSDADRALGRLAGAGRLLPNPYLLLQPYVAREALASSRIEGIQASLSDVFDAQARKTAEGPVREVTNYIEALEYGLKCLSTLPVSARLLCEVHEMLMTDVRGHERHPGELRRSQNWIGSPDNRSETAVFVPPVVDDMKMALDDMERFLHEDEPSLPPMVRIALIHYQFETIHPFLDGNGCLGRLLIAFLLVEMGLLPDPLLYLSAYFEQHRSEYYDRLQAVRERGQVAEWLRFFLTGVTELATDAVARAETLVDIRENYRTRLVDDRSRAVALVDTIFQNPVVTTTRVASDLGVTLQGALNLIRRLESVGIVTEVQGIAGRSKRWVALEVFAALQPDSEPPFTVRT